MEGDEGFELRAASVDDASAIAEIINEVTVAEVGVPWSTVEETRDQLTAPGRDPALADALLVQEDGTLSGCLLFDEDTAGLTEIHIGAFVRPHLWGRGLNAWLLRLGEERARARVRLEPSGERVVLRVPRFTDNEPARRLFVSLGYAYVRTFWMMRVDLESAPPAPRIPAGITIRTFAPNLDEARVHSALTEAFADHWGNSSSRSSSGAIRTSRVRVPGSIRICGSWPPRATRSSASPAAGRARLGPRTQLR